MWPPGFPAPRLSTILPSGCPDANADWPWTSSAWSSQSSSSPRTPTTTPRGIILLDQVAEHTGDTVRKALVDQGFKNQVVEHGAGLGIDVEIVARNPQDKGFAPQPKRWRVERTYGLLILHRRLVRDYEHRPSSSASRVYWAMTHVMTRRLTGANAPTCRAAQAVAA